MKNKKIRIVNARGEQLAARLEWPGVGTPGHYAIFAHCFTCSKDLSAVRNISRALAAAGIGVVRFDFAGLGESEGAFAETSILANVADLVSVGDFLEKNYQAPSLLIGHSFGGAAVLLAALELPSVKAVATVGSPAAVHHVQHLFADQVAELREKGRASVNIGGRPFDLGRQFLDHLNDIDLATAVGRLQRALLIAHSPQDKIVGIEQAAQLYQAARHPKSFLSLDGADHLLSNPADSNYLGAVIASWSHRYLGATPPLQIASSHQVAAYLDPADGFTTLVKAGNHTLVADEPTNVGGQDLGPGPYDFLGMGLASCTAMTLRLYSERKGWPLTGIKVHVAHHLDHPADMSAEAPESGAKHFHKYLELEGDLSAEQRARLLEIAEKCPVNRTLQQGIPTQSDWA